VYLQLRPAPFQTRPMKGKTANSQKALHVYTATPCDRRVLKAGSPLLVYEPSLALGSTTVRRLQVCRP
jgi:hypothetical protein